MTVSATLKGTKDSLGRRKVYIRIANGKQRTFKATNIKVHPDQWSGGKAKSSCNDYRRINNTIQLLILKYDNGFTTRVDMKFADFAKLCIQEWKDKKHETIKHLLSKSNKFNTAFPNIKLSQISADTLKKFAEYCYNEGQQTNSVWSCLKGVRVFIKKAHNEKLIDEYPFAIFKMPRYKDPEKTFLTKEQVESIDKFIQGKIPNEYKIAGAWFVISCYTGLRFGDQQAFNKKSIRNGRLIIYTSKTGQPVSIPMNDKLKTLFELVNYQPIPYSNVHYNRIMKAIAAECEIESNVSVHTARHTFGTLCASQGISQEVTAKLMGHSSIKTTAIYYQLTSDRLDSEFGKIF